MKLSTSLYDKILARDRMLPDKIAAELKCSRSCIVMLRWRGGRPTRRDGIERVRQVNEILRRMK